MKRDQWLTGIIIVAVLSGGLARFADAASGANPLAAQRLLRYVWSNNLACMACHAVGHKVVGPAGVAVAQKFQPGPKALTLLTRRIAQGGVGSWGQIPMPPGQATGAQAKVLARLVLGLVKNQTALRPMAP
ncbi:MAG: hypothetical protein M0Z84_09280 [Gammaproteobacteria bacterium]|nr:hypothetical protein [Gammaproteobacteria bacterium]